MLDNYIQLLDGRIKQLNIEPFKYDYSYSDIYNSDEYKFNSKLISYLRYGYVVGSIGKIPDSIVDVGYGNGEFLNVCKNTVSHCCGYDISDYPVPDGVTRVNSILDNKFDVITFFDSLEHFEDISFVKDLKCNYVCISVPWCHYFSDDWFENWKHRKPNEHIWHFNISTLTNFMLHCGFSLVSYSNIEDIIRKTISTDPNILTAIFRKV